MAREWKTISLGEVMTLQRGFDLPIQERRPGKVPIVSSSGITDFHDTVGAPGPGVVTGRYGTLGKVFLITEDYWPLNTTLWVKDFHGNDPQFASYLLRTIDFQSCSDKSSVPGVNRNDLHRIPVLLPPLREQQAIACILGALDDKIELNRQRNRTLEAMARAIFKSWFVDFDPVRANATRQQPPGFKLDIAKLFPDAFEEPELGEIPKGWRIGRINDIAGINESTLGRKDMLDTIDYVEISEVMRGELGTVTRYARGEEPSRARRRTKHGDTALSTVRPDRGAHYLVLNPPDTLILSTGFAVLSAKDSNWAFLHIATTQPEFGQELGHLADGGAYPAVRPEVIGARGLVLPSDSCIVAAFEQVVQPMLLRADANRSESRTLAAIRDALLPKLISGDLRVPDAERIVGKAM